MTLAAFLFEAFQSGAFQSEAETEIWAFQQCAFQWDAFQADFCEAQPEVKPEGGIGHDRKKRQKRVYLERDGKILVFANASRAASYVAAEKHAETEKPTHTIAPKRAKKAEVRAIHQPVQEIAYDAIATLVEQYSLIPDIHALIRRHEIDALMALYAEAMRLQDEEDIELLLMAA